MPGTYEDLEQADLVVLVGSNLAWCHPVLYQRLLAARKQRGTKIVVIDPRRTATADECDLHLPLDPGTDVLLFNGLLAHLARSGASTAAFVAQQHVGLRRRPVARQADALDRRPNASPKAAASKPADLGSSSTCSPRPRKPSRSTARA